MKLSIRTTENIYICDRIDSPFIFGIIKPRIYLPSRMNEEQKESVIAHERAHLKRLDHFGSRLVLAYFQCTGLIRYAGWHIFFLQRYRTGM